MKKILVSYWVPIDPCDYKCTSMQYDFSYTDEKNIIIPNDTLTIYLPTKIMAEEMYGDKYTTYHLVVKSKHGFTVDRLIHAGYQLLINSIDDIFEGENIWEQCSIQGIEYDENTSRAYVITCS